MGQHVRIKSCPRLKSNSTHLALVPRLATVHHNLMVFQSFLGGKGRSTSGTHCNHTMIQHQQCIQMINVFIIFQTVLLSLVLHFTHHEFSSFWLPCWECCLVEARLAPSDYRQPQPQLFLRLKHIKNVITRYTIILSLT